MSLSELYNYYYSQGRKCSRCGKPIRNINITGLCYECIHGFKKGSRSVPKEITDDDLKILVED